MTVDRLPFDHPVWIALGGAVVGYATLLIVFTAVLFGLAWLAFATL